jgi:hypothetical protein
MIIQTLSIMREATTAAPGEEDWVGDGLSAERQRVDPRQPCARQYDGQDRAGRPAAEEAQEADRADRWGDQPAMAPGDSRDEGSGADAGNCHRLGRGSMHRLRLDRVLCSA